jgi:hypothetical protein
VSDRQAEIRVDPAEPLQWIARRRIVVRTPLIHFALGPGDGALVSAGDAVAPGVPLCERTLDARLVDVGPLSGPTLPIGGEAGERRRSPCPGNWWRGTGERRASGERKVARPRSGTLLYQAGGRWKAAAGEYQSVLASPVHGVVREARNGVGLTIEASGTGLLATIAAGEPSRGCLDLPGLPDGDLPPSALDVSRSGRVVVAGSRVSAQAIGRARAMSIHGLIAASAGENDLRDLRAAELRQRASLAPPAPFGLIVLDGYQRRPIAGPILALLVALAGRDVAIVTDPPMLVFDGSDLPLPEMPPDWIRVRSGRYAGREGRFVEPAGDHRFAGGMHLDGAVVCFADETEPTILPFADLERFEF